MEITDMKLLSFIGTLKAAGMDLKVTFMDGLLTLGSAQGGMNVLSPEQAQTLVELLEEGERVVQGTVPSPTPPGPNYTSAPTSEPTPPAPPPAPILTPPAKKSHKKKVPSNAVVSSATIPAPSNVVPINGTPAPKAQGIATEGMLMEGGSVKPEPKPEEKAPEPAPVAPPPVPTRAPPDVPGQTLVVPVEPAPTVTAPPVVTPAPVITTPAPVATTTTPPTGGGTTTPAPATPAPAASSVLDLGGEMPPDLVNAPQLRQVVVYLTEHGVPATVKEVSEVCTRIREKVPALGRVIPEQIPDRIERVMTTLGMLPSASA